jgi:hypothetical protein
VENLGLAVKHGLKEHYEVLKVYLRNILIRNKE